MLSQNSRVFKFGKIIRVTRLPLIRIVLGKASSLETVKNILWWSKGKIFVKNENSSSVYFYDQSTILVLDVIIDNEDIVCNIHAAGNEYGSLKKEIQYTDISEEKLLSKEQVEKVFSMIENFDLDISKLKMYYYEKIENVRVIVIDNEILKDLSKITCNVVGLPSYVYVNFKLGDAFEIEDEEKQTGYRIKKGIFDNCYKIYNNQEEE